MAAEINEKMIAEMVREILMKGQSQAAPDQQKTGNPSGLTAKDYPLATKRTDLLTGPRGKHFNELTLEEIEKGNVNFDDFKITPDSLEYQAQIAESAGRPQIALNLRRAAELTKVPDERVLEMYNALRPHRSTKDELLSIAGELRDKFGAKICGDFVEEAAHVYERRKLLKGDLPTE